MMAFDVSGVREITHWRMCGVRSQTPPFRKKSLGPLDDVSHAWVLFGFVLFSSQYINDLYGKLGKYKSI